jgi:hypothetical protein
MVKKLLRYMNNKRTADEGKERKKAQTRNTQL